MANFRVALDRLVATPMHGPTPPPLPDDVALLAQPEPRDLIAGRIRAQSLVALVGPSGIGKTFTSLDLGLSVASGRPWLGAAITQRGPVIYVPAEGGASLAVRVGAWKIAHACNLDVPLGLHTWAGAVNLLDASAVEAFLAAVAPLHPVAVVWDTFARCFVGGDENSAKDVGVAVAHLDRVRTRLDATQVLVHHMTKGGTSERGSGALRAACDTLL